MNITSKKEQHWLWEPEAEIYIALLAKRLCNINSDLKWNTLVRELNYTYLRKRKTTKIEKCSPTLLQRYFNEVKK